MSCYRIAVTPVCRVKSTCSKSAHSRISVELVSHADTCVVSSNVLVVHDHGGSVDIFGFGKETQHTNACIVDVAIVYGDHITYETDIIMINQAVKIDSMKNTLVCHIQCGVHDIIINKCPKFLSGSHTKDNNALLVHDPNGCSPPLTIPLLLHSITSYFEASYPSLAEYEKERIPKHHLTSESLPWDPSTSLYSL